MGFLSKTTDFISNYKRSIEAFLWVLILVFAYQVYNSINAPIKFNEVKTERYLKVIDKLKDIRNAQIAYKTVNGVYADNFDGLIKFIDSAQYTLIQKRDSSYMKYDRVYRIDMLQEIVVIDTLFGDSDRYKTMAQVPIDGIDKTFSIKADVIDKNGYNVPVFEVRISKDAILYDQNKDLLKQEKALMSVDGVNGPDLVLGSMTEVSTNGNWPTTYDAIARK
jgi:hypothetical protein